MTTSRPPVPSATPPEPEEVSYPHVFGPYALLCALGRGGMGAVHLAKHGSVAGIEKYCVVKTLRQKHVDNEEYISRFMDEARLVVHLAHRNICPIFDVGRVGTKHYLAMELIEGRDLHTLVESCWGAGRPIAPAVALYLACEVLEALDYAHRRTHPVTGEPLHIVHRDVSPHNVMVNFEGEVKLIDFGLAASSLKVERTDPNIVLGKLSYMSREHLRAQPVDGRHDLFGVAVMLYEMLAGERYYADVPADQILPLLAEGKHLPRKLATFDAELQGILTTALASDAKQRTATCGALRDRLQQYMVRRQLSASTRELRSLMDELFPGEHTSLRALLQRFQDVQPPPREENQSTVIARAAASGQGSVRAGSGPSPRPVSQRMSPLHEGDALDFGEVDSIGPASGPAGGRQAPNAITEPTGRVEMPAAFSLPATVDHSGAGDATLLVPRTHQAQLIAKKERRTAVWVAAAVSVALVVVAAGAWLLLSEPPPDAEGLLGTAAPSSSSASAPPASAPPASASSSSSSSPSTSSPSTSSPSTSSPSTSSPPASAAASASEEPHAARSDAAAAAPKEEAPRTVTKEKPSTPPRRSVRRRPPPAPAKAPPLAKDATPEEKVRYLDRHCRSLTCGRTLVDNFRRVGLAGMTTDEVREFWPRVNRCIRSCSE